jgi:hypothetical protein
MHACIMTILHKCMAAVHADAASDAAVCTGPFCTGAVADADAVCTDAKTINYKN